METIKVAADSDAKAVAGALAAALRTKSKIEVQAVGAGAVNQAVKAIAICRGFVAPNGLNLVFIPAFSEVVISGEIKTAIKLLIQNR